MYVYKHFLWLKEENLLASYVKDFVALCLIKELIWCLHLLNQSKDLAGVAIGISVLINIIIAG